jgi:hypothetical protein
MEAGVGIGLNRCPSDLLRNLLSVTKNPVPASITKAFLLFKNYLPELRHYSFTIVSLFFSIESLKVLLEV